MKLNYYFLFITFCLLGACGGGTATKSTNNQQTDTNDALVTVTVTEALKTEAQSALLNSSWVAKSAGILNENLALAIAKNSSIQDSLDKLLAANDYNQKTSKSTSISNTILGTNSGSISMTGSIITDDEVDNPHSSSFDITATFHNFEDTNISLNGNMNWSGSSESTDSVNATYRYERSGAYSILFEGQSFAVITKSVRNGKIINGINTFSENFNFVDSSGNSIQGSFSGNSHPVIINVIMSSASGNGSITPAGAVIVPIGKTISFTITPNDGYEVDTLMVDSDEVGSASSYTFTEVLNDYTIFVTFKVKSAVIPPPLLSLIELGSSYSIELKSDGSLWAWGHNIYGQLGDGTTTNKLVPTQIDNASYSMISVGSQHNIALKSDGSLWAWGFNSGGQLGDGTTTSKHIPTQIGTGYSSIVAGGYHTLALKSDGSMWGWGRNDIGQLGDGTMTDKNVPTRIGTGYSSIAAGLHHSFALKSDGSLWAWGSNYFGQLGDGTTIDKNEPTLIGNGYSSIMASEVHTIALKTDGSLWAWGSNYYGQLGDGTLTDKNVPTLIGSGYSSITVGGRFSVALKTNGSLWAWGSNDKGQLGDGTLTDKNVPTLIGSGYSSISAGANHGIALKSDGSMWAWGKNYYGELGDGTAVDKNVPTQISGF